jgi:hypothetical protein
MQDVIQPLTPQHCECLDKVLASGPITADLLAKCAYCFEPNPALHDHVQDLIRQNAAQVEIARRIRSTIPAAPQQAQDYGHQQ